MRDYILSCIISYQAHILTSLIKPEPSRLAVTLTMIIVSQISK